MSKKLAIHHPPNKRNSLVTTLRHYRSFGVALVAAVLVALPVAKPARAFITDELSGIMWQMIDDFLQQDLNLNDWVEIIQDFLGSSCMEGQPVIYIVAPDADYCNVTGGGSTGEMIEGAQGDMGVPNPNTVRGEIEADAANAATDSTQDVFELNPVVHGVYAANNVDRDLTRIQIQTILSEQGQAKTKEQIDATQEVVEGIATDADDAQSLDVTQDVMKKQIKAFAQQSLILGQMRSDALQARLDTQFTNLNLTNMSRTLDEVGRSDRSAHSANAMFLIEISGLSQLQ